jgi:hypothetical protein
MSSYATHRPVLEAFLSEYNERVLELGCGPDSTPIIVDRSKFSIGLEDNKGWFPTVKAFEKPNHEIRFVTDWNEALKQCEGFFDLVFVDCGVWQTRCDAIFFFKEQARITLLHDSFVDHLKRCHFDVREHFKFRRNFYPVWPPKDSHPPTIALSNFVDVTTVNIQGFEIETY